MCTLTETNYGICPKCKEKDFYRNTCWSRYTMICERCWWIDLRKEGLEFTLLKSPNFKINEEDFK